MTRAGSAQTPIAGTPGAQPSEVRAWLRPRVIVLASAGTGKTFTLTSRYLRALLEGALAAPGAPVNPSPILATTFTRKAAGEILGRVLERLLEAEGSPGHLETLARDLDLPITGEHCRRAAASLARQVDRVRIMTLDSLTQRLARAAALDLDVPPGWSIGDEPALKDLHARAIERTLEASGDEAGTIESLRRGAARRPLSREVFATMDRVVGEAHRAFLESGRTRALWEGVGPTTPALDAAALTHAIATLERAELPRSKSRQPNGNFVKALAAACAAARAGDWEKLATSGLGCACIDRKTYYKIDLPPALDSALRPIVDHACHHILARIRARNVAVAALAARYHEAREALRRQSGLLAFDDLPRLLVEANVAGRLGDLWYRLDGAIDHLLIDEAQDTALIQYYFLRPIIEEVLSTQSSRGVMVVGDIKQSLYGWRQAEPDLLPAIRDRHEGLERESLWLSQRSSRVVLDAVNRVFQGLASNPAFDDPDRPGARDAAGAFARDFKAHQAAARAGGPDGPGLVELRTHRWRDADARRPAPDNEGGAADAVKRLIDDAASATGAAGDRAGWRPDVGVLVRRNKHIRPIIAALAQRGIEASEEGGAPLADDPAVAAALSLLHLADHPTDTLARYHVACSPVGVALEWNGVPSDASTRRRSAKLRRALCRHGYARVLERLLERIEAHITPASVERMDQLIALARGFDDQGSTRPSRFVELVCTTRVARPAAAGVRVMTIHAAKGLEFDAVVLPDLDPGSQPPGGCLADRAGALEPAAALSMYVPREIARLHPALSRMFRQGERRRVFEQLCTLYVGMTRARRALVMLVKPFKETKSPEIGPGASGILRGAFTDGCAGAEEGELVWSNDANSRHWAEGLGLRGVGGETSPTPPEIEVRLAQPREGSLRRARVVAPSRLGVGEAIDLGERLSPAEASGGADVGTLVHAMLEAIEWLDGGVPEVERLRRVVAGGAHGASLEAAAGIVDRFLRSAAARCLARGFHGSPGLARPLESRDLDLRREWSFLHEDAGEDGTRLVSGAIDRLVLVRPGGQGSPVVAADILDFKTDTVASPDDLERRSTHHAAQMRAYARSVARMFALGPSRVRATLVFVGAGELVTVDMPSEPPLGSGG